MTTKRGLQVWNAGRLWFDTNDLTTRFVGNWRIVGPSAQPGDTQDSSGWHHNFYCQPGTTPFVFAMTTGGGFVVASVARIDSTTAQLTYAFSSDMTSSAVTFIMFGFG